MCENGIRIGSYIEANSRNTQKMHFFMLCQCIILANKRVEWRDKSQTVLVCVVGKCLREHLFVYSSDTVSIFESYLLHLFM